MIAMSAVHTNVKQTLTSPHKYWKNLKNGPSTCETEGLVRGDGGVRCEVWPA